MAFTNTPPQLLTRALAEGRCLLLFDGLDEVADRQARARLARSLVELARLFPGNRVIIGSRPAGVSESEGDAASPIPALSDSSASHPRMSSGFSASGMPWIAT